MELAPLLAIAMAFAAGGMTFFTIRWLQTRRGYSGLSKAEQRRAEITSLREKASKLTLRQRIHAELLRLGLAENQFIFWAGAAMVYLVVAAPMALLKVPTLIGLAIAFPASFGATWLAVGFQARRRRSAFNKQLVDLLDLTVSQIQGGVGAERALQIVVPQMAEPIRTEMLQTLAAGQAGKDLVAAMQELATRYPSRAFDMFVAALEIDRAEGHAIAPALDQAATLLKQDFALAAEANAKLGQVKYEFYAVAVIVLGIALFLIVSGGPDIKAAYSSPAGIIVLAIAAGNAGIGFFRFNRKIAKLTGDTK